MSLTLSGAELARLQSALDALLAPLASDGADAWRASVNRALRSLLQADKAMFILPLPGAPLIYSDEFSAAEVAQYEALLPSDHGRQILLAQGIEVWNHSRMIAPDPDVFYKSGIYADFYQPYRLLDGIGYCIDDPQARSFAIIKLHHERYGTACFGERGVALLRMLLPALKAGVANQLR